MVGDIVIIQDNDLPQGQWKLGKVVKAMPGIDQKVRKIEIQYKNKNSDTFITIERAVQKVSVILPVDDKNNV